MATENRGYKAAARHFNLNADTVKSWERRAKANAGKPAKVWVEPRGAGVMAKTAPKPPPSRVQPIPVEAFAPEIRRDFRMGVRGLARMFARVEVAEIALAEAEKERARLRAEGTPPDLIDELCPLPKMVDMRQVDAGSRAMRNLLEISPGLAAFDAETGGKVTETAEEADADARIEAVFGRPTVAPLQLVARREAAE